MTSNTPALSGYGDMSNTPLVATSPVSRIVHEEPADTIDLRRVWSAAWRNRMTILAVMAACLALGVLSLFLSNSIYRATASIEINNQAVSVLGTETQQPITSAHETDRLLQTQVDILQSRNLAERVASELKLGDDFLIAQGVKPVDAIRQEQIIRALRENLSVALPRNSRVIPVSFESTDPGLAAQIANEYVETLITGNLQRHFATTNYSKEFLEEQLGIAKSRLEDSEQALLTYARSVGIVDPRAGVGDASGAGSDMPGSLTSANLVDLNSSLAAAQNARIQAEGRWRAAQATATMSLPEVLSNPAMQELMQRRAELEAAYQEQLQQRRAGHPSVMQAASAISAIDRSISSLAASIRNSIRNEYTVAQRQEAQLAGRVSQLKGATFAEQQDGIRYNILKREVDTNRELYDGLLQRFKEVSAEAGVASNNISIVDRASKPILPVSPRPVVNMILALLLGIVIAAVVVALRELFSDGIRNPDEVEARFGLPLLGSVPRLTDNAVADHLAEPNSEISEAYQAVRTSVDLSTEMGFPRTMLITSSRPGEGKSTTALAMARNAAATGAKVLLIDGDMRRPALHKYLEIERQPGLSNFLTQQLPVESVVRETEAPNLYLLPAGSRPPNPAELVSGQAIKTVLAYLQDYYDHIIIDSPPVLGLADAPRLASIVDATIVVIEANRSQRGAINATMRRLRDARAKVIGAVLVKLDPSKVDFGSAYLFDYYSYGQPEDESAKAA